MVQMLPLEEVERRYIQAIVRKCGGNVTRAAAVLGTDRRTLQRLRKRWKWRGKSPR